MTMASSATCNLIVLRPLSSKKMVEQVKMKQIVANSC